MLLGHAWWSGLNREMEEVRIGAIGTCMVEWP